MVPERHVPSLDLLSILSAQNCFIFRVKLLGDSQICRSRLSEQVLITRGVKDKDTQTAHRGVLSDGR